MDEQRESRRAKQHEMLEATAVDLNDESDLGEVLEISREARKIVAGRRRQLQGNVTSVEEDEALEETAYLLRSPTNAQRLRDADAALRAGRFQVQLSDSEYDEFVARLNEPAQVLPELQALLAKPSPFSASEGVDQSEALLSIGEDRAIAPMVVERLAAGGGRPFNELLIELGMPELATPPEPDPLDSE